jgi:GH25 family lysozyme M1 (1,4-beta-N-acetylmuramidase)
MYSNHGDKNQTMSNSGCGPTADADVVATLIDPSVDPWTLAQLSLDMGDRTYDEGTKWTLFKPHTAEAYGFHKVVQSANMDVAKACLDAGGYVVCSMKPGYWTKNGHFICAWKYDDEYMYANDPASSDRKKQPISQFKEECKQYFGFYPLPKPEPAKKPTSNEVKRGEKIVDISKYQPDVDYDSLISDTALIILRAGYRGTGGGIHEDQKFALHASELKKRGVRFGVYFFSIAKDEAQAQEETRAFWQYAKGYDPLFWTMDAENESITGGAIREFAGKLRRLGAGKVGCYVANHLYNKYDYDSLRGCFDFTWIPRYGSTIPAHCCDLWQYTSTGRVDGISGNVDLNRITGQGHDLSWFTGGEM